MGKRGPVKKPNELKMLEGNPGKREISKSPKYDLSDDCREPPAYLGTYAKREWKRILPLLEKNRLMTDADYITLAAYCQSVDTWIHAEKAKKADGFTYITDKGNEVQRAAVGIANSALANILKFGREFGLSPASRANISAEGFEEAENPLLSLIKQKKQIEA